MFAHNTRMKLAMTVAAVMGLGAWTGCHADQPTASATPAPATQNLVTRADTHDTNTTVVNHSLGASDGLGAMLILQESAQAAATAEAKVQDGSYDQWYASFERDPDAVREAKAQEPAGTNQTGTGTYVDVPIPEPVR